MKQADTAVHRGGKWFRRIQGVCLLAAAMLPVAAAAAPPPDVILISIDTLRADRLGCYGYAHDVSPAIDAFAADALLFERCYSHAPFTGSSCASFLSGFLPHETRVFANVRLPGAVDTLAERLRSSGYATAAVVSNYVLRRGMGFEQGFDLFDDTMDERELVRRFPERIAARTADRAIALLRLTREKPLFLWVHFQDPHGPYTPPAPFDTRFQDRGRPPRTLMLNRSQSGKGGIPSYQQLGDHREFHYYAGRYDGEIAYLDGHFGRLVDELKRQGRYDRSLVVVTADHGEGMGEHDFFFAHGVYLYDMLIHVPLIIRGPGAQTGRRKDVVQHIDIVPTVLAAAGLQPEPGLRGRSLFAENGSGRQVLAEMKHKQALIEDTLKLIRREKPREEYLLFDRQNDPGEETNLVTDPCYAETAARLRASLQQLGRENLLGRGITTDVPVLSREEIKKLEALGYMQ